MSWHCCWGHCGMTQCRQILSRPQQTKQAATDSVHCSQMVVPVNSKTSSCPMVYCTACLYDKQHCHRPDLQSHVDQLDLDGSTKINIVPPGALVSYNQYVLSLRGRLEHTRGKEQESQKFLDGTIFVDYATKYVLTCHQIHLTAAATVTSKHHCEEHFSSFGVSI